MVGWIALWLITVVVAGILVFWAAPRIVGPVFRVLGPTWLPLAILVIAAYALFGTDQGRDLGVALLGSDQLRMALLALALLYWATGSWHAARLGLIRRFGNDPKAWPTGYHTSIYWWPRVLGACAHLFAACSLALAARNEIGADETILWGMLPKSWIVWVAPLVILLGTVSVFLVDRRYRATRAARASAQEGRPAAPERADAQPALAETARRLWRAILGVAFLNIVAVAAIVGAFWLTGTTLPTGFVPATAWVLASAVLFLLLVSVRHAIGAWLLLCIPKGLRKRLRAAFQERGDAHAAASFVVAGLLALIAVVVIVWAFRDPLSLGDAGGSMVVGFLAFGVYIALIDLLRLLCEWLFPRMPEDRQRPARIFAGVVAVLLLIAGVTSAYRDFHRVRLCGDSLAPCHVADQAVAGPATAPSVWVDARPTVAEAAEAWLAQAQRARTEAKRDPDEPIPLLVIATAGGGIRAAQWTAMILEKIEQKVGADWLRQHLFAISGVSGGSVGAAFYAAAVRQGAAPTAFLDHDFLAPAVAAMAFVDVPSSFLPEMGQGDRGYALERSFEVATGKVLGRAFLSFFPTRAGLDDVAAGTTPWRPALLLNATHQKTGRRVIASHLKAQRHVFLDAFDAHALLQADMPASTAAHNSARFTYVSPAGKLVGRAAGGGSEQLFGHVLDGGYFENFGAITALQLVREVKHALRDHANVQPVILQISSDPTLTARDRPRLDQDASLCSLTRAPDAEFLRFQQTTDYSRTRAFFNELSAPLAGVLGSRSAHGTLASQELAHAICVERRAPREAPGGLQSTLAAAGGTGTQVAGVAPLAVAPTLPRPAPEFAHLAMCDEDGREPPPPVPPLGWSLSDLIREQFPKILERCGNPAELERILSALRPPAQP